MVKQPPPTLAVHLDRSQPRCQVGLGGTVSGGPEPVFRALLCFCGGGQWAHGHVGASQSGLGLPPLPSLPGMASAPTPLPAMLPLLGIIQPRGSSHSGVASVLGRSPADSSQGRPRSSLTRPQQTGPIRPSVVLPRVRLFLLSCIRLFLDASLWNPVSLTWHLCLWGRNGEQDC